MIEAGRLSAWQAAPDAITALRGGRPASVRFGEIPYPAVGNESLANQRLRGLSGHHEKRLAVPARASFGFPS